MENENSKPKVTVLGMDLAKEKKVERKRRHRDNNEVGGVLILLAGCVLLLNTLGIVPWSFWQEVSRFWPTILILLGAQVIAGGNYLARFLVFLLSVAIFGFAIAVSLYQIKSPIADEFPPEFTQYIQLFDNIKKQ